ncbi:MAG: rhamnogalacturonan acetylesterase [Burkholderiales bacterium]|nr:rhamnogalacturonan acetylesterase [Phycisphaerae bacterium]
MMISQRLRLCAHAAAAASVFIVCQPFAGAQGVATTAAATQPWADLRFDFGPGKAKPGHTAVSADTAYSSERGYGFDNGVVPTGVESGGDDPATDGLVASERPFFFSVKVPEGNYKVTITFGDPKGESHTTLRAETGRVMAADISTAAGEIVTRSFIVNIQKKTLPAPPANAPGWPEVHMFLPSEPTSRRWDEKMTLAFNGARPCVSAIEITRADDVPTVFLAGDSTVGDPHQGHGGNWSTQIPQYFKPDVAISNNAEGGETTKSFLTGARLDKILSQMKPGDFLLIQFAHNDSKKQWPQSYTEPATTFKAYLKVYLEETRRRGGTLVLVTPMERRSNEDSVGPWARAMREFAEVEKVPIIDQWTVSKQMWTALGPKVGSAFSDQTHLSAYGGYLLSKVVAEGIKKNVPELAKYMFDDFQPLDMNNLDQRPGYLSQPTGVPR